MSGRCQVMWLPSFLTSHVDSSALVGFQPYEIILIARLLIKRMRSPRQMMSRATKRWDSGFSMIFIQGLWFLKDMFDPPDWPLRFAGFFLGIHRSLMKTTCHRWWGPMAADSSYMALGQNGPLVGFLDRKTTKFGPQTERLSGCFQGSFRFEFLGTWSAWEPINTWPDLLHVHRPKTESIIQWSQLSNKN